MFRPVVKRALGRRLLSAKSQPQIKTLEDLAKLKSLDDVDPKLISRLINQKTNELNTQNELQMLKDLQAAEMSSQEASLKKFVRPGWIFLLMASIVYLSCHYVWWKLEYEERETEFQKTVTFLERELDELKVMHESNLLINSSSKSSSNEKRWYKFW